MPRDCQISFGSNDDERIDTDNTGRMISCLVLREKEPEADAEVVRRRMGREGRVE